MSERPITDPNLPGEWIAPASTKLAKGENSSESDKFLATNGGEPRPPEKFTESCPWRHGHTCHIPEDVNKSLQVHIDRFQRCLLCLIAELVRELEFRRRG